MIARRGRAATNRRTSGPQTIVEDASTPAIVANHPLTGMSTASFSPPANSLLVALVGLGYGNPGSTMTATLSDSTSGTWTSKAIATGSTTYNCYSAVFCRYLSSAPGSMTVTLNQTSTVGGWYLAVRVLTGAAATQTGAAATFASTSLGTDGTIAITTTATKSRVYGIACDPQTMADYTVNGSTTLLSAFKNSIDGVTEAGWKASAETGTPGSVTLGGTWSASDPRTTACYEVLPA